MNLKKAYDDKDIVEEDVREKESTEAVTLEPHPGSICTLCLRIYGDDPNLMKDHPGNHSYRVTVLTGRRKEIWRLCQ